MKLVAPNTVELPIYSPLLHELRRSITDVDGPRSMIIFDDAFNLQLAVKVSLVTTPKSHVVFLTKKYQLQGTFVVNEE